MNLNEDLQALKDSISAGTEIINYKEMPYVNLNYALPKNVKESLQNILNSYGYWGKTQYQTIGKMINKVNYKPVDDLELEINLKRNFIEIRFNSYIFDIVYSDFENKREAVASLQGSDKVYMIANKEDYLVVIDFLKTIENYLTMAGFDYFTPIDILSVTKRTDKKDIVAFSGDIGFSYLVCMLGKKGLFGR